MSILVGIQLSQEAFGRGGRVHLQPASRVRVAGVRALRLGPPQHWSGPGGPAFAAVGARINLVLEIQQANMTKGL